MAIDASQPEQVGPALLEYLTGHLGASDVQFAEPPERIGRGMDTYIYAFRLSGDGLDPSWTRPLVLRCYPSPDQADKAEREAAVQRFAASRGYPALEPLAVDSNAASFGLPIMVMERAPGTPLLDRMAANPLAVPRLLATLADAHVALHNLPVADCPLPSEGPLVERRLAEFRSLIDRYSLSDTERPLAWLEQNKRTVLDEEPSLCHNDYHPFNVLLADDGRVTVLDWSDATLGDRHHDVARTVGVLHLGWALLDTRLERLTLRLSRGFIIGRYLHHYRRRLPIDRERLRYWEALHAFQVWLQLLELDVPGSEAATGARPDAVLQVPPGFLDLVRPYFWQRAR